MRRALRRCEFVFVQDACANIATADFAGLLLPASSWGEKDGTLTNNERRISRLRAAVAAPAQARAGWQVAVDVARRIEARLPSRRVVSCATLFPYDSGESVCLDHRESNRRRDPDITDLDNAALDTPRQWPFAAGSVGTERM